MQKDDQLNRLREANLELRSQIFELNKDVVDLLEIVEVQRNRRGVSNQISFSGWQRAKTCEREMPRKINKNRIFIRVNDLRDCLDYKFFSHFAVNLKKIFIKFSSTFKGKISPSLSDVSFYEEKFCYNY